MKRLLLLVLVVFAGIGIYANTSSVKVSTPDFGVRVSGVVASTTTYYASVYLTTPSPSNTAVIGNIDWDFGDGSAPVLHAGPTHKHEYQPGTYTITLTFTYVTGETFVVTKPVTVTPID